MPSLLYPSPPAWKPQTGEVLRTQGRSDGLDAAWECREGGLLALDRVRNRHGTVNNNAIQAVAGGGGTAWYWSGAGNIHIDVTNDRAHWDFGTRNFSIESLFSITATGAYRDILRYDNGQSNGLIGLRITNTNTLNFLIADGSRNVSQVTTTATYTSGKWFHVLATRQAGLLKIFVDGVEVVSGSDGSRSIAGSSDAKCMIGGAYDRNTGNTAENWSGFIAFVRVRLDVPTIPAQASEFFTNPWALYQQPLRRGLQLDIVEAPAATVTLQSVLDEVSASLNVSQGQLVTLQPKIDELLASLNIAQSQQLTMVTTLDEVQASLNVSVVTLTAEQEGYRWRDDDGDEDAATWLAAQDSDITAPAEENVRLRILTNMTGDQPSQALRLQYRKVGDPDWEDVL